MALVPPRDWQPSIKQEEFQGILRKYQTNPEMFDEDSLHELETHASYYRLPFARSADHQTNFVGKVLKNLGKGFIEGWTTIPTDKKIPGTDMSLGGKEVTDTTEAISRSIGHLAGFVGYLPLGKYIPLYAAIRGKSIPLKAARKVQNMVAPKAKAMIQEAGPWAQKFAKGTLGEDLASGAFHLGVASAVSSWTEGIDTMISSGSHGAIFGGVFRGIGNMPGFGKQITAAQLSMTTGRPDLSKLSAGQKADLSLRTLAGSMFQGLPSTMQGATTEEQVYAYLLGAYFGFGETPLATRTSREFMTGLIRDRLHRDGPEAHPRWKELTPTMQEQVKKDYEAIFGPEGELSALSYDILDAENWSAEKTEQLAKELGVEIGITEQGQTYRKITKEDIKELKRKQLEKKNEEDPEDLDMHMPDWDKDTIKRFKLIGDSFMPFIERHMERLHSESADPHIENVKIAQKIFTKWETLQKPLDKNKLQLRPVPNAEREMKKWFAENFDNFSLKAEHEAWWRNYAELRRHSQPVMSYYLEDGKPRELDLEGKNSLQREKVAHIQPPLIQNIYNNLFKSKRKTEDKKPFLTWFDHEVIDGKEYDLLAVKRVIRAKIKWNLEKQAEKIGDKVSSQQIDLATQKELTKRRSRLFKKLNEEGYYYMGGRGDKKRMYFVRYHPDMIPTRKELKSRIIELRKAYQKTSNKNIKLKKKDFDKYYELGKKGFKKHIFSGKDADLLYDKALVSNMMYDLSWNGMKIPNKGELGIGRVLENGFINEAKGYNKRAQIWLNTGLSANERYVDAKVKDLIPNKSGGRAFSFFVYGDPSNPKVMKKGVPAILQAEFYDGGAIMRRDVLKALNQDKGLPYDGGANKSFIVAPREGKGTILGKYMFHVASPKMNTWMENNNVHFIMPKSGIKQTGKMDIVKNVPELESIFKSGKKPDSKLLNELPIHQIRTVMSEITSAKAINSSRLVKQAFTTVSMYGHKNIDSEVFNRFVEEMTGRSYKGEEFYNNLLKDYQVSGDIKAMKKILDNIESVNIGDLLNTMRNPKYEHFAQKAYERILKINESVIKELGEEGELSRNEVFEEIKQGRQFQGVLDRIMQLYPDGDVGGATHKWAKNYRMVAMRNYVVHSMTKPKIKNSATARMRPYDWGYREEIRNIKENEYFVDDGFRKKILYDEMLPDGKMSMGDMWTEIQKPKGKGVFPLETQRQYAEEILEAVVLRVPMDSMSGAHVLKFGGFTSMGNSESYGVLLHPSSMRALGGADLDGDKAHLYFGGNQHGLRKEYKQIYKDQVDEFIRNGKEMHNKESIDPQTKVSYKAALISNSKEAIDAQSPYGYYDPYARYHMSMSAAEGRDTLSAAVVGRANVLGAYNAIRGAKDISRWNIDFIVNGKKETHSGFIRNGVYAIPFLHKSGEFTKTGGKEVVKLAVFKIKTGETDLERFRGMSRASVALGSDPMDEAGLKNVWDIRKKVLDTLFDYEIHDIKGHRTYSLNKQMTKAMINEMSGSVDIRKFGLHNDFAAVNNALYGKNYSTGRRHSYSEILQRVNQLNHLPSSAKNTLMPMLAEKISTLDWSDNILRRVEIGKWEQLVRDNNVFAQSKEWLKEKLGRTSIHTPESRLIKEVINKELYLPAVQEQYWSSEKNFKKIWNQRYSVGTKKNMLKDRYILGNPFPEAMFPRGIKEVNGKPSQEYTKLEWFRKSWIKQAVLKAEDAIVNDISDMVTLKRIVDILDIYDIPDSTIKEIITHADSMKLRSHINTIKRGQERLSSESAVYSKATKVKKFTSKLDQFDIDTRIRGFKENLSKGEKELYDTFLIGTFSTADLVRIKDLKNIPMREKTPEQQEKLEELERAADNTSLSQVGYNSKAVSNVNISKFFNEYSKLWKKAIGKEESSENVLNAFGRDPKKKVTSIVDDAGRLIKGEILEEADFNPATNKYLHEVHPFIGLHKGKVKDPELREAYHNIRYNLNKMHNSDAASINQLFRWVTGVNINVAKKTDWLDFSRYLESMHTPGFLIKSWNWIWGKQKDRPKRAYYWGFPAAINRDLLRNSPAFKQLKETVAPYKDHLGNTIMGKVLKPMSSVAEMQQQTTKGVEMSMQVIDEQKKNFREKLAPYVSTIAEGDVLYDIAVRVRERNMKNFLYKDAEALNSVLKENQMMYEAAYVKIREQRKELSHKEYKVNLDGKIRILRGEEVLESINKIITDQNVKMHNMLVGDPKKINEWLDIARDKNGNESWKGIDKLRVKWSKYFNELLRTGERLPIEELGIDGIRQISKRILFSHMPESMRTAKRLKQVQDSVEIKKERDVTGKFPFRHYYPHESMDRKLSEAQLEKALDKIFSATDISKKEKNFYAAKLISHHRQMSGDILAKDEMSENFDIIRKTYIEAAHKKKETAKHLLTNDLKMVGNQFSRRAHIDGYDRSPEAYESYMRNIIKTFYDQAIQVQNRNVVNDFSKRFYKDNKNNWDADTRKLASAWSDFFTLYAQSAMGHPVHIPESVMSNPLMKIKGTPYKWFADSQTKKRIDAIRKQLGVGRKTLKKWNLDEATIDELTGIEYAQLNSWSALEAKYQLASLLAHPKSSIANLYGGSVHTVISTGWQHWRNARNFEYLQTNVNPEWRGMEDVERFLQKIGVQEEFLIHQAGMNPAIKGKRWDGFIKDATKKLKKDPDMSDRGLLDLKRQYKLSDGMWQFAASFMRRPERVLRRDAYMAHLLQAKELFGNAIKDYDHPFLIEMAKKGVKATQFLYSAPHRPMWTNSALGRVFSRFQLWSWNSVRFRNDILRDAKIRGYVRGTPEYDKFIRLAQADVFMLAMSNLFMYSLFENALPAPWNWFQDTADWLMGDEVAQERAFYGSPFGPVQMVTPPALRLLPPLFKGIVQDDYSKLTDYYMWTMLPFGRLIRDVAGPGGAIENPYYSVTKMTGIPVLETGELFRGEKNKEEEE